MSLFVEDELDPFDPVKTIYDFIQFVDRICVVALQVGQVNALNKIFFSLADVFIGRETCRPDFRRPLVFGLSSPRRTGSFPEQRLVIEPKKLKKPERPSKTLNMSYM